MTARMKRCATFVTVVMTLFLSACRMDGTVEIHADGSAETVFVFEDDDGKAERIHRTCEGLQKRLALVGRFAKATMEDITPPGGHLTCKSTLSGYLYDEVKFYETKDSYSLTFSPLKKVKPEENYIKPTLTISMPGKVVKTSMGEVVGNKVIIKGFGYTTKTLSIVAEKEGAKSVSSSDSFPSSAGQVPVPQREAVDFLCGGGAASVQAPLLLSWLQVFLLGDVRGVPPRLRSISVRDSRQSRG